MEPFATMFDNWKLLTSVARSLVPPWLSYDFQLWTEEGCSNVNSLVEYVDDRRSLFVFIPNTKCNHDSSEPILETLSMSEKALKMLLNIFSNVNAAARLAWGQPSILKQELAKFFNKHLRMNASINLESLTEMPQHFGREKFPHKKKYRYLDKLAL